MGIQFKKKNHIAYVIIDRPEAHNAIDPETAVSLAKAWREYKEDKDLRCAIITGQGQKSFCAGLDLQKMTTLETGARPPEAPEEHEIVNNPKTLQVAVLRDFDLYKPVIAAINGYAIAGGMEIVQACDIRISSENAKFGLTEAKWALFPRGASTVRLPRQIPFCKAMEIMLTGELMDAQEALRVGFINYIVSQKKVLEKATEIAEKIVKNGPLSTHAIKKTVLMNIGTSIENGLIKEWEMAQPIFDSLDAKEGPKAFKEKRQPKYIGK